MIANGCEEVVKGKGGQMSAELYAAHSIAAPEDETQETEQLILSTQGGFGKMALKPSS